MLVASDQDLSHATEIIDSMPKIKRVEQVAISPDGKQVAAIVEGQLSVSPANGGDSHSIPLAKSCRPAKLRGAPTVSASAIIADLDRRCSAGGDLALRRIVAKKLTELNGFVETPALFS